MKGSDACRDRRRNQPAEINIQQSELTDPRIDPIHQSPSMPFNPFQSSMLFNHQSLILNQQCLSQIINRKAALSGGFS
ncbi:MAG TPA: hypothetical protein VMS56_02390 [Thermoanaerobaculia bacterium]|nr:hypothetical protein [Thermoanaerobaculia bacterium]